MIQRVGKDVALEKLLLDKIESRATGHCLLQKAFRMFDTTSSQDITLPEFKNGMDRIGMNVAMAVRLRWRLIGDGGGDGDGADGTEYGGDGGGDGDGADGTEYGGDGNDCS